MMQAIADLQAEKVPRRSRRKPVKGLLPVNLRNLFPSRSLRNFASYITPEIDPRTGDYTFSEICAAVHHRMGLENNTHTLRAKFAANVASEKSPVLKVMPLFIKNIAMKAVFNAVGERKSCLCLSNLGAVELPEHPGAGAGAAFLPGPASAGSACEGGEQPAGPGIRERSVIHVLYPLRRGAV